MAFAPASFILANNYLPLNEALEVPKRIAQIVMYSIKVVKVAIKESFTHMLWLMALIGIPMVYFSNGLDWLQKSAVLLIVLVLLWLMYIGLCFTLHRFSLRKPDTKKAFQELDDIAKGKEVGRVIPPKINRSQK